MRRELPSVAMPPFARVKTGNERTDRALDEVQNAIRRLVDTIGANQEAALDDSAALPFITIGDGTNSQGDFTGSNQQPFREALAACYAAGGGLIFVKRGTYIFTETLTIAQPGIVLLGESSVTVIIEGAIDSGAVILFDTGADACVLRALTVRNTHLSSSWAVRVTRHSLYGTIQDCGIEHDGAGVGGDTNDCRALQIEGGWWYVTNNYFEVKNVAANRRRAALCLLSSARDNHLNAGCGGNYVAGNILFVDENGGSSNAGAPILLLSEGTDALVEANHIVDNRILRVGNFAQAIRLLARGAAGGASIVRKNVIRGNVVNGTAALNIALDEENAAVGDLVTDNACYGNPLNGGSVIDNTATGASQSNSLAIAGKYVAAASGGAVTTKITDTMLNG